MMDRKDILKDALQNILEMNLNELIKDELYIEAKECIAVKFKEYITSDEIKTVLYKLAEEQMTAFEKNGKSFKDILPKGYENSLKVLVYNKGPEITKAIRSFITTENFKRKIKSEINKFVSGLGPMVSRFINTESIYMKIMSSILLYVENPETAMNIVVAINSKIDEGSTKSISEFTNYIPYEGKMSFLRALVDMSLTSLTDDVFIKSFQDSLEQKLIRYGTVAALLKNIGIDEEKLLKFAGIS